MRLMNTFLAGLSLSMMAVGVASAADRDGAAIYHEWLFGQGSASSAAIATPGQATRSGADIFHAQLFAHVDGSKPTVAENDR